MADPRPSSLATAEQVTLWSLLGAVSLFTAGQIAHASTLDALGIHGLRQDAAWQDRVFEGGAAVLNMTVLAVFQPALAHLPWLGALLLFGGALWFWHRTASRPRLRLLFGGVAGASWLALLITMGLAWGRLYAGFLREPRSFDDHFVFAADAQTRLPAALLQDNQRRALRLIASTPEFLIALGGDGRTAYRIAVRDVELLEATPR